jgi:hypothetical protein
MNNPIAGPWFRPFKLRSGGSSDTPAPQSDRRQTLLRGARRAYRPFLTGASGSSLPFGELYPLGGIAGAVVVPPFRACALISRYVDNRRNRIADRGVQFGLSPFAGNTGIQLVQQVNETLWWRLREIIPVP